MSLVRIDDEGRTCNKCAVYRPWSSFTKQSGGANGKRATCRHCWNAYVREWSRKSPKAAALRQRKVDSARERRSQPGVRLNKRLAQHGLSQQEYDSLLRMQEGKCPVCNEQLPDDNAVGHDAAVIDHDHACCPGRYSCGRCVRGILHRQCNSAIGFFRDNPTALRNAASYLARRNTHHAIPPTRAGHIRPALVA